MTEAVTVSNVIVIVSLVSDIFIVIINIIIVLIGTYMYLNLFKSTQSTAGLKALNSVQFEACCQWALLNVQVITEL